MSELRCGHCKQPPEDHTDGECPETCRDCGEVLPEDNISDLCGPCAYDFMVNWQKTEMP